MKKYLIVLAAAVVALASCQKEQPKQQYTAISFKQTELSLSPGEVQVLNVLWQPETIADAPVCEWSSSNEAVATVANGRVTGVAEGNANITAKCGELTAVCPVTVVNGPLDLIHWGGFGLFGLEKDNVLSNDTVKVTLTSGQEVSCVMIKASWAIWDDGIASDPETGDMSGVGYFVELPGTALLITDDLGKGPNYYYLSTSAIQVKDIETFNWADTANAYCCVTGKLGDAAKHLQWYNDSTATVADVTEFEGGVINAVNWGTSRYVGLQFGLAGTGIFVEDETELLYKANFSWFTEDDVYYGLKGILEYDETGEPISWSPKEPAEWGALTPKYYEYLGEPEPEEEEGEAVARKYTVREFVAPAQDYHKFVRSTDVLIKK